MPMPSIVVAIRTEVEIGAISAFETLVFVKVLFAYQFFKYSIVKWEGNVVANLSITAITGPIPACSTGAWRRR